MFSRELVATGHSDFLREAEVARRLAQTASATDHSNQPLTAADKILYLVLLRGVDPDGTPAVNPLLDPLIFSEAVAGAVVGGLLGYVVSGIGQGNQLHHMPPAQLETHPGPVDRAGNNVGYTTIAGAIIGAIMNILIQNAPR